MKYPLEQMIPYWMLALIVLVVFYGIYFSKMMIQRANGIKTNQIGSRKEKDIHRIEVFMAVATYGIVLVQVVSIIIGWNHMPDNGRLTGFLVAMIGNIIFLISVVMMKDSWRAGIPESDKTELVCSDIWDGELVKKNCILLLTNMLI